ncbi:hydantoinase B/oxoprolinase family protein [Conexibacter stalactiti]|uniref:Hydantoinase B/oxoprolinase family protein n=1 Tax=Conexibacter stalactiti TaxID=1940611 RepID=A0ABU4HIC3_9ACTN|nr:hydantoinase B/oxoprolinase family protein [Conexibacter stalactiti]MDW5593065.1 hydantoinase B/oxoprolinase family protein [Conexibacter stalactiti]MEC5033706.1 hydantoinase B/oxoprolinase family protein [Conexibacter stalactiti]
MSESSAQLEQANDGFDPITFSVMLSRFNEIVKEMTQTLERTAWSAVLALVHDYSCAIYDARQRQVAMGDALPIHVTSMHLVLDAIAESFGDDINEGDVFLCNHPFMGNTHVGDVVTAEPVFANGQHLFWSVAKGHQQDIGAFIPASLVPQARDVWQEGLHIPPVKIYDRGAPRKDVIEFYLANLRYKDMLRGDLHAQLGSIRKGRVRLRELVDEYGIDTVVQGVDRIIDYSDKRMGHAIQAIPDGVYRAEGWVDSDGADAVDIPIKVTVTIDGDRAHVDYAGSAPQSPTGINGTFATSQGAGAIPFLYYIDPDVPHNHGCLRHLEVSAPEGTICNARYPASTSAATVLPTDAMQDIINKAMVDAAPDLVIAGSARCAGQPMLSGFDDRNNEVWGALFANNGGGGPAARGADGWPIYITPAAMGGQKASPIEQLELLYPLLCLEMEIEPDSMGLGEYIGGPGIRFAVQPTHSSIEGVSWGDGLENPPHGIRGGTMAAGGGQYIEQVDGSRRFLSANAHFRIDSAETHVGVSTGGGGWGNPYDRDVEDVRRDVRDGIVSRRLAEDVCGVVLTGETFEIDWTATAQRRAALRRTGRPPVEPTRPSASTWRRRTMTGRDIYLLNPVLP